MADASKRVRMGQVMREVGALGRQSLLLGRNLRVRAASVPEAGEPVDVVVLVHGFLATAGVFGPLETRLRQAGVEHLVSFTYHPFRSPVSLAEELREMCDRLPPRARLHLIGHSLGGLVARLYVEALGGIERVTQTISLASPFGGAPAAERVAGTIGRWLPETVWQGLLAQVGAMRPDGPVLRAAGRRSQAVRHTSIVAADDLLVPVASASLPGDEVILVDGVGHNGMLFDGRVIDAVCALVLGASGGGRRAAE
ncbi:MAG: alpha/beta fold hydrolase [Myxococcales bacterium]|nr:MAG: alpha/beta fold hydrolase [Myxococcales bacterium]